MGKSPASKTSPSNPSGEINSQAQSQTQPPLNKSDAGLIKKSSHDTTVAQNQNDADKSLADTTSGNASRHKWTNENEQTVANTSGKHHHHKRRSRGRGRFIIKNLWQICCNEIEAERKEVDAIIKTLGLPPVLYRNKKSHEIIDYESAPDLVTCKSKDFLDFYVFPYLLPAIQELVKFARINRIFQAKFCTFNAMDFIVEYLYNNNPRYPERAENPVPIFEIPFAKEWLEEHPRSPPPKWMLMTSEDAAVVIQRAVRGFLVRCKPDIQEMRQFWKEFRRDAEEERKIENYIARFSSAV